MPDTAGLLASGVPSRRRVEAITFCPMSDALRNHLATTSFVEMSNRLALILGSADANFCSLAVWPSFTIGATIHGGEEQRLQNLLAKVPIGAGMRKRVTARVLRGRAGKSDVLKKSLAAGNHGVFYELGLAFVDFLKTFAPEVSGDDAGGIGGGADTPVEDRDAAFEAFADRIGRLPDPPGKLWPKQDRTRLIAGFRAYVDAIDETDQRRRSQLLLLGNLCIVDYEQCRLQGWLDISMVGPLRGLTRRFDDDTTKNRGIALVERTWTRVLTKRIFVVEMAGETVRVGRPIPPHPSSGGALPITPRHPRCGRGIGVRRDRRALEGQRRRRALERSRQSPIVHRRTVPFATTRRARRLQPLQRRRTSGDHRRGGGAQRGRAEVRTRRTGDLRRTDRASVAQRADADGGGPAQECSPSRRRPRRSRGLRLLRDERHRRGRSSLHRCDDGGGTARSRP